MNRVITSHQDSEFYFPLYQLYYNLLVKLVVNNGEEEGKYAILSPDCSPSHLKVTECRKNAYVKFYVAAYTAGIDPNTMPDINSCDELVVNALEFT